MRRRSPRRRARTAPRPGAAAARPSLLVPHELAVARVELVVAVEPARVTRGQGHADRAAVTDDERGQLARPDVVERRAGARHVLAERLAVREPERVARVQPRLPVLRMLARDVVHEHPLPRAPVALAHARLDHRLDPDALADDLGGHARAQHVAGIQRADALSCHELRQLARLRQPGLVQGRVERTLDADRRGVEVGLPVAGQQDQSRLWKRWRVSARSPSRSVSSGITSSGRMLPRLTPAPRCSMNQTCWWRLGASKIRRWKSTRWMISSIRPVRASPSGRYMPASPLARPSQTTFEAPASSASSIISTQR